MKLRDIALLNMRRRKAKAAFSLTGLMIGVATVVTLITLFESVSHNIMHKMEKYGANIMVVPKSQNLSLSYGGISLGGVSLETQEISESDVARIHEIPSSANLAAVGPMVLGAVRVGENDVMLAGVDFQVSRTLKPWWELGGILPRVGSLIVGSTAADILSLSPGDSLMLRGSSLTVERVLGSTGSQDDQIIFTDTRTAQRILGKDGKVSLIEVAALCSECPIESIISEISTNLPNAEVMAIKQVVQGRMNAMSHFENFLYGISILVVLVGCLVVFVTMMGSVRERTREIGIFRAIGFRRSHVMHIVLFEAAVISLIAGILGYGVGIGASWLSLPLFTDGHGAALYLDPLLGGGAVVFAVLLGLISSIYHALIASRLDPNEALRAI
ncbi:MAG: ABC transporter permease [Deltaproteobacteria bacterium]|nr:MAG: ABC transporter permease [Deltaproteobacteria bacterium]